MNCARIMVAALALASCLSAAQAQPEHFPGAAPLPLPTEYEFGARSYLRHLAFGLETNANQVCWEMHRNYRHSPGWDATYREAYQILRDAKHLHELVHDGYRAANDQDQIAADLHAMDKLFHHVQGEVARWQSAHPGAGHPQHDPHAAYHGDLSQKLARFEETLHHLMTDYGIKSTLPQPGPGPTGTPADASLPPLPPQQP